MPSREILHLLANLQQEKKLEPTKQCYCPTCDMFRRIPEIPRRWMADAIFNLIPHVSNENQKHVDKVIDLLRDPERLTTT